MKTKTFTVAEVNTMFKINVNVASHEAAAEAYLRGVYGKSAAGFEETKSYSDADFTIYRDLAHMPTRELFEFSHDDFVNDQKHYIVKLKKKR